MRSLAPLTLKRTVIAARYCARHAKSAGMAVGDINAAVLAVELLMRLERRDRGGANAMRKAVFDGSLSVREMRKRLKAVPDKKPRGRSMDDWSIFALSMIEQLYSELPLSFGTGETSALGKLLRVDIEVTIEEACRPHAIFISPLDDYSECAGLTIDDQFPFIMAAALVYPRVNLALHEPAEAERFFALQDSLPRELPADLRLIKLYGDDDELLGMAADGL